MASSVVNPQAYSQKLTKIHGKGLKRQSIFSLVYSNNKASLILFSIDPRDPGWWKNMYPTAACKHLVAFSLECKTEPLGTHTTHSFPDMVYVIAEDIDEYVAFECAVVNMAFPDAGISPYYM